MKMLEIIEQLVTSTNIRYKAVSMVKSIGKLKIEHDYNEDYKYCFTVPSHMLIMRRNNKIFISGNSGKTEKIAQEILNYVSTNRKNYRKKFGGGAKNH